MLDSSGNATPEHRRSRPWTVYAAGVLLLLQAAGYVALSIYLLLPLDWDTEIMSPQQSDALSVSFILIPAAILAVLSAIFNGCAGRHRVGICGPAVSSSCGPQAASV